jgi:hypothetical protein
MKQPDMTTPTEPVKREVDPPPSLHADWVLLLHECIDHAKKLGASDPQLYFESESGLVVLDGDHHSGVSARARPDNVVFRLPWPLAVKKDVGSW